MKFGLPRLLVSRCAAQNAPLKIPPAKNSAAHAGLRFLLYVRNAAPRNTPSFKFCGDCGASIQPTTVRSSAKYGNRSSKSVAVSDANYSKASGASDGDVL